MLLPCRNWVYPRVCGGTVWLLASSERAYGLSPRVRGNLLLIRNRALHGGSIPACAGEPVSPTVPVFAVGVYPRVCGGTGLPKGDPHQHEGLSPRVRGNP